MDGTRVHVAVEGHPVEAAGSREGVGPRVGREALEESDLVKVEVDAAVVVGGGGSDEGEGLGGALFGGVIERVLGELEALLAELANRLLARGASVDGTAAGECGGEDVREDVAVGVVREDGLELLEGLGLVRGDAHVLDAASDPLDVVQRMGRLARGGSLRGSLTLGGGFDLHAARAKPSLLLFHRLQFLVGGHRARRRRRASAAVIATQDPDFRHPSVDETDIFT